MNLRYIGAMMMVVRSLVAGLNLVVRPASGHPLSDVEVPLKFAAMVPLQVYNTLRVPAERKRLEHTDILIIGGGAVDDSLEAELKTIPIAAYSTYGMTETLSHIALRRLNGEAASKCYYPFPSVELSLSAENTLIVKAPLICDDVCRLMILPVSVRMEALPLPDGKIMSSTAAGSRYRQRKWKTDCNRLFLCHLPLQQFPTPVWDKRLLY